MRTDLECQSDIKENKEPEKGGEKDASPAELAEVVDATFECSVAGYGGFSNAKVNDSQVHIEKQDCERKQDEGAEKGRDPDGLSKGAIPGSEEEDDVHDNLGVVAPKKFKVSIDDLGANVGGGYEDKADAGNDGDADPPLAEGSLRGHGGSGMDGTE